MKKISLIIIGLILLCCNKESKPKDPTVTSGSYKLAFMAGDYGTSHFKDIVIRVNGDSLGILTSHTTNMNDEDVVNYYVVNGSFPSGALQMNVNLNSFYNVEAYTSSGQLIGSTGSRKLVLISDNDFGGNKPWLTDDNYTGNPGSPVGTSGNDCSFIGINKTLLLLFEIDN